MTKKLRVACLFAGIGGLARGFCLSGHTVALAVENNPSAQKILKRRFKGVRIIANISSVCAKDFNNIDCIVLGFPCNDVSTNSAERLGLRDGVSTRLVERAFSLLKQTQVVVPFVVLENVLGLLKWHHVTHTRKRKQRPAIDYVVSELEKLGYRWAYRVVDVLAFGIPHSRQRVFIVACKYDDPRDIILSQDAAHSVGECVRSNEWKCHRLCYECFLTPPRTPSDRFSISVDLGTIRHAPVKDIISCLTTSSGSRTGVVIRGDNTATAPKLVKLSIEDAEALMSFPRGYTEAPGLSDAQRFTLLGLSCSVAQSEWIASRLARPREYEFTREREALAVPFETACPGPTAITGDAWPMAAYNIRPELGAKARHRVDRACSHAPVICAFTPLGEFLKSSIEIVSAARRERFWTRFSAEKGFVNIDPTFLCAVTTGDEENTRGRYKADDLGALFKEQKRKLFGRGKNRDTQQQFELMMGAVPNTRHISNETAIVGEPSVSQSERTRIVEIARQYDHRGANLALLGERAVSRRLSIYWELDNTFYPATLVAFNDDTFTFDVAYDDGTFESGVDLSDEYVDYLPSFTDRKRTRRSFE